MATPAQEENRKISNQDDLDALPWKAVPGLIDRKTGRKEELTIPNKEWGHTSALGSSLGGRGMSPKSSLNRRLSIDLIDTIHEASYSRIGYQLSQGFRFSRIIC